MYAQEVKIGAKAGLNISTIAGDVPESYNPRLAYHFGGFANIPISESISLNPELLYFSIGNTFDYSIENFDALDPNINTSFKTAQRANFLAVPVNFRYNFTDRFGLDFGPQVSFLLNTFDKIKEATSVDPIFVEDRRLSGNFRPDYGVNLGLTFSPNDKINVQLRYYQGLKNLTNGDFFPDDRSSNVALQLSVGYAIF
jgi:hypothetical protein